MNQAGLAHIGFQKLIEKGHEVIMLTSEIIWISLKKKFQLMV